MNTYQGKTYNVTYVGNTEFDELPGAQLTIDAWGLDQISRRYSGRLPALPDFLRTFSGNRRYHDPIYPGLTMSGYTVTEGYFPTVEVTCKGTHDGSLPGDMPPATDMVMETISLQQYDGADVNQVPTTELTYQSPITTWKYVTRERPTTPKYLGQLEGNKEIIYTSRRGAREALVDAQGRPMSDIKIFVGGNLGAPLALPITAQVLGLFNGVAMTVTKGPKVTPAGIYFECEESVQRLIFPFDLSLINWTLSQQP